VAFVEVIPVHLVDSHREHLFIVWVDSLPDDSIVEALVDINSRGVAIVEDEWVPERLWPDIISFVVSNNLE
jgi:hypothetical protein